MTKKYNGTIQVTLLLECYQKSRISWTWYQRDYHTERQYRWVVGRILNYITILRISMLRQNR